MVLLVRAGPVFLYWSEWSDSAVVGPEQGAWGGDDIYHCDSHEGWQGDTDEATEHAASHGYFIAPNTTA